MSETFDPRQHITNLRGKEYLEVKWRLYWFRSQCPRGTLHTELVAHIPDISVVFKATVGDGEGAVATGYAEQGPEDFKGSAGWFEKAETKAIGRALGHLGFGTQFTEDDEDEGSFADSPVEPRPKTGSNGTRGGAVPTQFGTARPIQPEQRIAIGDLAREMSVDMSDIETYCTKRFNASLLKLTAGQADALIGAMKMKRAAAVAVAEDDDAAL